MADVAGKGTSAALYMAELKGLLSSLARTAHSPKSLLCQVNRILADFKAWREAHAAVQVDPVWSRSVWTATK